MVTIYALVDPETKLCRYVGKTKHTGENRLKGHLSDARRRSDVPRFRWIRSLAERGLIPEVKELALVPDDAWQKAERFWISHMKELGIKLLNATSGGDGIHDHRHTEETRKKMSESAKEIVRSQPEVMQRRKAALKLAFSGEDVRRQISERMKILCARPEFRESQRARSIAASRTPEARARSSRTHKGKVTSEAVRKRISDAHQGKVMSMEARRKMSIARTGRRNSPETIERMRASARLRYARLRVDQ